MSLWRHQNITSQLFDYNMIHLLIYKLMAQKLMKEVFDSYFEFGKFHPRTTCHLNTLVKKCNGNVMELGKVGSKKDDFLYF